MAILLTLALFISNSTSGNLLNFASSAASIFHEKCVQTLPTESVNRANLSSLLCGDNVTDAALKENLVKTSLIHIFIISGSHLILLDELLCFFRFPFLLRLLFLGVYSLTAGWQPPAVRALLALSIRKALSQLRWNFPADLLVALAGLLTLALFPAWWSSLSLIMSWCAALGFCWTSVLGVRQKFLALLLAQLGLFLLMSLPLWGMAALHPLSLLYNLMLAPVVAGVLLPLAALAAVLPLLLPAFDRAFACFEFVLQIAAEPIVIEKTQTLPVTWLWLWILFWHLFFHFLRLYLHRGKDHRR